MKNVFRINKKSNNKNVMKVFVAYSKNVELCGGIEGFPSIVKGQRTVSADRDVGSLLFTQANRPL